MTDERQTDRAVKSIRTTFRIIETLRDHNGARLTDLAKALGLAKSTVHQHLQTLTELGYVVKEDGRYYVGLRFLSIGEYTRTRKEAYRLAGAMVRQLAEETSERVQFFAEEHGQAIYVHTEQGSRAVQTDRWLGERRYLHSSAGGKAILAYLPEEEIQRIIDQWGLPAETENTITTKDALDDELAQIRSQGYSINDEESITGLRSIAVPVLDSDDTVIGSFSLSGPTHRLRGKRFDEELPNLLLGTANELELRLAYP
jgi:DNA-binding IclR family transcriptional regulator